MFDPTTFPSAIALPDPKGCQLAPDPLTTSGGLQISAQSYYNPFGIDYRSGEGNAGMRLVTLGNRRGAFGTAVDHVSTGFKGSFGVWNDQQWNWDVGMDYGHVSQQTQTSGLPNLTKVNQATLERPWELWKKQVLKK